MPLVQQLYEKYQNKDVVVLTVNLSGSRAGIAKFMTENKYTFPALIDTTGDAQHGYHIQYVPTTFLIDKDGNIRDKIVGGWQSLDQIEGRLQKVMQ
jgi:peroxiredoxin